MKERHSNTQRAVMAGCFTCQGTTPIWSAPNALALAARHHDATGHPTWADQVLRTRYGKRGGASTQVELFCEAIP